jgi:hypothetical protein
VQDMNVDLAIEPEGGFCRVRIIGPFDATRYTATMDRVLAATGPRSDMLALYDLREVSVAQIDTAKLRSMGTAYRSLPDKRGKARVAILVSVDLAYGLCAGSLSRCMNSAWQRAT